MTALFQMTHTVHLIYCVPLVLIFDGVYGAVNRRFLPTWRHLLNQFYYLQIYYFLAVVAINVLYCT